MQCGRRRIVCRERARDRGRGSEEVRGRDGDCRQGSDRAIGRDQGIDGAVGGRKEGDEEGRTSGIQERNVLEIALTVGREDTVDRGRGIEDKVRRGSTASKLDGTRRRIAGIRDGLEIWRGSCRAVGAGGETHGHPVDEHGRRRHRRRLDGRGVEGRTGGILKVEGGDGAGSGSKGRNRTIHRGEGVDGGDVRGERVSGGIREAEGGGKEIR